MEASGIASGQRVVLSITVNRTKNLRSGEEGRLDQRVGVKNGEPGPECGQPGATRGDLLSLFDSEDSFEPMWKRKHPFLANKN